MTLRPTRHESRSFQRRINVYSYKDKSRELYAMYDFDIRHSWDWVSVSTILDGSGRVGSLGRGSVSQPAVWSGLSYNAHIYRITVSNFYVRGLQLTYFCSTFYVANRRELVLLYIKRILVCNSWKDTRFSRHSTNRVVESPGQEPPVWVGSEVYTRFLVCDMTGMRLQTLRSSPTVNCIFRKFMDEFPGNLIWGMGTLLTREELIICWKVRVKVRG